MNTTRGLSHIAGIENLPGGYPPSVEESRKEAWYRFQQGNNVTDGYYTDWENYQEEGVTKTRLISIENDDDPENDNGHGNGIQHVRDCEFHYLHRPWE